MIRLTIHEDAAEAAHDVARRLRSAIESHPACVLGLPTGRTPIPVYEQLVAWVRAGDLSLGDATTFNLDEFAGLGAEAPGSFQQFMQTHLFGRIPPARAPHHFLDGLATDLEQEARRYEQAIADAGGLDVVILGLGTNGHIGFNEPAEALPASTRVVELTDETRRANVDGFAGVLDAVPHRAITMGVGTMLAARRVVLIATGASKAAAVAAAVDGPLTTRVPASLLQLHPHAEVVLDLAAAARLRGR